MSEKSSFFNSVAGDRKYNASDFANYFNSLITNGVMPSPSNSLQIISNSNMTVTVKSGKAWINGYVYTLDADLILALSTADGTLNRIDRAIIQFSSTGRAINAIIKQGTVASSPVAPVLQRDADFYELGIADILVGKGVTTIPQAKITDIRMNSAYCGWVNSLIQVDGTTLYAQLTDSFNTWFASLQGELSGDIAGNLQAEIDNLASTTAKKDEWSQSDDVGKNGINWRRTNDGYLEMWGYATVASNKTITFPQMFSVLSDPQIQVNLSLCSSVPGSATIGFAVPTISSLHIYTNTSASLYILWSVKGK